jgi:hypothetical protein
MGKLIEFCSLSPCDEVAPLEIGSVSCTSGGTASSSESLNAEETLPDMSDQSGAADTPSFLSESSCASRLPLA